MIVILKVALNLLQFLTNAGLVSSWLQVCEALPVQSAADVMQRELESCLGLEYTAESLPPLLLQVQTQEPGEPNKSLSLPVEKHGNVRKVI